MSYSKEISTAIKNFLERDDWNFEFDEENGVFRMSVTLTCKIQNLRYIIDVREDSYFVCGLIPLKADSETRVESARLLNMINWNLYHGCYEMDDNDGEVRFRMAVKCADAIPSEKVIRHSVYIPAQVTNKYGNAIAQVVMGFADAHEAFAALD